MGKIKTAAHAYTSGGILCPDIANTPETRRDNIPRDLVINNKTTSRITRIIYRWLPWPSGLKQCSH